MLPIPPEFMTSTVDALLRGIRGTGDRSYLPIIADALMDAGCEDEALLAEFRARTWGLTVVGFEHLFSMDRDTPWPKRLVRGVVEPGETVRIEVPDGKTVELFDDWQVSQVSQVGAMGYYDPFEN